MNKKFNPHTSTLALGKTVGGYRRSLLLGVLFTTISTLAGCGAGEGLNNIIAKAVGDKNAVQRSRAPATKSQVYNCKVRSITRLEPSGLMEESPATKALFTSTSSTPKSFIFDEKTGVLRGDGFKPLEMTILQKGTNENSAIGYSTFKGSVSSGIAVLRIKKWEVGLPFLFLDSATLWTGSCETM
jgi:hypothetical protein